MNSHRAEIIDHLRTEIAYQGAVIRALPEGNSVRTAYLADIVRKRERIRRLRARDMLDTYLAAGSFAGLGAALLSTGTPAVMVIGGFLVSCAVALLVAHRLGDQ